MKGALAQLEVLKAERDRLKIGENRVSSIASPEIENQNIPQIQMESSLIPVASIPSFSSGSANPPDDMSSQRSSTHAIRDRNKGRNKGRFARSKKGKTIASSDPQRGQQPLQQISQLQTYHAPFGFGINVGRGGGILGGMGGSDGHAG